jgi:hypothetical protein
MALVISALTMVTAARGQVQIDPFSSRGRGDSPTIPSPEQIKGVRLDPRIREVVSRLDDDSFMVREQATQALVDLGLDRMQLYAVLDSDDLSHEQRFRVLTCLRELLIKSPRGALGIQMPQQFNINPAAGPVEIRIDGFVEGLPAERVLRIGDRIIEIDHRPLDAPEELNFRIQSKKPGDTVHLRIKRQRTDDNGNIILDAENQPVVDELDIDMKLGSADLLDRVPVPEQFRRGPNGVELLRRREADEAAKEFSPPATTILVQGGTAALSRGLASEFDGLSERELDPDVERHPAIRAIRQQRKFINEGLMADNEVLRASWRIQLTQLWELQRDPMLSESQRAELLGVIERFTELMGQ